MTGGFDLEKYYGLLTVDKAPQVGEVMGRGNDSEKRGSTGWDSLVFGLSAKLAAVNLAAFGLSLVS